MKISVDKLASVIASELESYRESTNSNVKEAVKEVAKESAQIVKSHVPSKWSNKYKSQIKASSPTVVKNQYTSYIYMYGEDYRIAHLLEHGHALVRGGRTVGQAKAFPHFIYGDEYAQDELPKRIEEKL